jgi:hypothetical protein
MPSESALPPTVSRSLGHRAAASGGSPRGDWRRDGPHIDESAQGAAMRA